MHDRTRPRPTDNAFLAASPYGGSPQTDRAVAGVPDRRAGVYSPAYAW